MPSFSTNVPNPLGQADAVAKLKGLVSALGEKYKDTASDVKGTWTDNVLNLSLAVMGFTITGKVTVEEQKVSVEGTLPLAASMFRGRIEESIKSELEKELAS